MKKLLVFAALIFSVMVSAQVKLTEGKITTKQTMSTDDEQVKAQLAMMGDIESVIFFKGENIRSELENPMSGPITIIVNPTENKLLMLMDNPALGKKFTLQENIINEEAAKDITVTKGTETKTVLGYTCQQYIVKIPNGETTTEMIMYTTDKIKAPSTDTILIKDKLSGFPLYTETKVNQMGVNMTIVKEVTKIEKEAVSSELFKTTPPEGYTSM